MILPFCSAQPKACDKTKSVVKSDHFISRISYCSFTRGCC